VGRGAVSARDVDRLLKLRESTGIARLSGQVADAHAAAEEAVRVAHEALEDAAKLRREVETVRNALHREVAEAQAILLEEQEKRREAETKAEGLVRSRAAARGWIGRLKRRIAELEEEFDL
jgi:chromosome segregation ATPase